MKFEWDLSKSEENRRKHGVSFEDAAIAYDDPMVVEALDSRFTYAEERWQAVGKGKSSLIFFVYTMREDTVRIISAREATRHEQNNYYSQNAT